MKIAVVGGTGYVGLTTAVCLASKGHFVFCVGRNKHKIEKLQAGVPVIYEESLEEMLKDALKSKTLVPTVDLRNAVGNADISFLCVGTPCRDDGSIDLEYIESAAKEVGQALAEKNSYHVVVVKSTVVPGTTEEFVIPILEDFSGKRAGVDFGVCMNPEFLREGRAVNDFLFPKDTGVVIGELDKKSGDYLFELYKPFDVEILRTQIKAAEMIKYARNSYLAKDVSFANEIANICQQLGVDYLAVKRGMEMDTRIGKGRFLDAGAGFGGSCFPKDVRALLTKAKTAGVDSSMLDATLRVNQSQPSKIVDLARQALGDFKGKKIGVLGLAFKPGTDDMREAASIKIVSTLVEEGAEVHAYDPKAMDKAKEIFGEKIAYANGAKEALSDADACMIVTEWPEFANPEQYLCMHGKIIIDGRRVLNQNSLPPGFTYNAVGFPKTVKT
jgi:UDPglucose 6-dehydrogenase